MGMAVLVGVLSVHGAEEEASGWDLSVALGAAATSGNSESASLNGSVSGKRTFGKNAIDFVLESNYGEADVDTEEGVETVTETQTTTDNSKAALNYKRTVGVMYLALDNSLFRDDLAGMKFRLVDALSAGKDLVKTDSVELGIEGGLAYIREDRADTTDEQVSYRLAARYDQKLSDTAKGWISAEYLLRSDDADDYLASGEVGLEAVLAPSLSLRIAAKAGYDSIVPEGTERDDLSLLSSVVYTL